MEVKLELQGLPEVQAAAEAVVKEIGKGDLLNKTAKLIERQAKANTGHGSHEGGFPNVQMGRLSSSWTTKVDSSDPTTWAQVGTNVEYAEALEFGHKQTVGRFVPAYALGMRGPKGDRGLVVTKGLGFRLVNPFAPAYPTLGPAVDMVRESGEMEGIFTTFGARLEDVWSK